MSKFNKLRKGLAKKEIFTFMNEPTEWISLGNATLNYRLTGRLDVGLPNRRTLMFWGESGCVDAETEFLTPTGWKRISDYVDGDQVAQFDKDNETMSFTRPTEYIKKPCTEFYHFKTKYGVDQMLTPEHRVLYRSPKGKLQVKSAQEIVEANNAQTVNGFRGKFLTSFSYSGAGVDLNEADLRLQVAVNADASFNDRRTTYENFVRVSVKKERKIERMRELLIESGREFKETPVREDGFVRFEFGSPLNTKVFDERYYDCTEEQLRIICDEVMHWDARHGGKSFYSTIKESADFIQFAFSATGRRARITEDVREGRNTCYQVNFTDVKEISIAGKERSMIEPVETGDGFKYCFAVDKTFLVLRRNGCVFITGNTGKTFLTSNAAKEAQDKGYRIIYLDSEDSISEDYMTKIGINLDEDWFIPVLVDTIEEATSALAEVFSTMEAEDKFILIIDSLAGLLSEKEEKEFESGTSKGDMGQMAKKLKLFVKNINKKISNYDAFCIMVTHAYQNQDMLNGEGRWICSGGKGMQFFPSFSIKLEKAKLKEGSGMSAKVINGVKIRAEITKTRFTAPFQKCELKVPYDRGLEFTDGLLDVLEEDGVINKNGGWYSFEYKGETIKFQGSKFDEHYEKIMELYSETPEEKFEESQEPSGEE